MNRLYLPVAAVLFLACGGPTSTPEKQGPIEFEVLTKGKVIDLDAHTQAGAVTVFDVYADWCGPCKKLDQSLVGLKKTYGDRLVIYKLDLVNWESELALHHGIKDLPYLIVYDENRELLDQGPSNQVLPKVPAHLNRR